MTERKDIDFQIEGKIKNGSNHWLDECMKAMNILAEKENLSAGEIFKHVIDSIRKRCTYNCMGCNDVNGEHVAYGIDTIAKALNIDVDNVTCDIVCDHGCCAYLNQIMYATYVGAVEKNPEIFKALTGKEIYDENK